MLFPLIASWFCDVQEELYLFYQQDSITVISGCQDGRRNIFHFNWLLGIYTPVNPE